MKNLSSKDFPFTTKLGFVEKESLEFCGDNKIHLDFTNKDF